VWPSQGFVGRLGAIGGWADGGAGELRRCIGYPTADGAKQNWNPHQHYGCSQGAGNNLTETRR